MTYVPGHVSSEISMSADDTKIYHKIKNIADCHQLQSNLDKLNVWSKKWLLSFNIKKCKYMRLGNNETFLTMPYLMTTRSHAYCKPLRRQI